MLNRNQLKVMQTSCRPNLYHPQVNFTALRRRQLNTQTNIFSQTSHPSFSTENQYISYFNFTPRRQSFSSPLHYRNRFHDHKRKKANFSKTNIFSPFFPKPIRGKSSTKKQYISSNQFHVTARREEVLFSSRSIFRNKFTPKLFL